MADRRTNPPPHVRPGVQVIAAGQAPRQDKHPRRSGLVTMFCVLVLALIPAFFAHQSCRLPDRESAVTLLSAVNWVNCHLRFPSQERTLEAYATWLAAVVASAAVYWAWQSFSVQSRILDAQRQDLNAQAHILHEQQRAVFLSSIMSQYIKQFSDLALWIEREILSTASNPPDICKEMLRNDDLVARLFQILTAWQSQDVSGCAREWAQNSRNAARFLQFSHEYDRLLKQYELVVFREGASWVSVMNCLDTLRAPSHGAIS